jgi:hypothetical protein
MFKLAVSLGASRGSYCGREGLYLGPVALIEESDGTYRLRPEEEIAAIFSAAYHACPEFADRIAGLRRIAAALQRGELAQAMIAALLLRLDEVSDEGLVGIEVLSKASFSPDQPHDAQGRWTAEGTGSSVDARESTHPALIPAQAILPFGARPPLFLEEPPKTFRPFKEPILSGKEGSKDVPSWARGQRPYVGENGRDFAKRLMDERYGPVNWNRRSREYGKLHKYGDRSFRDPGWITLPDDGA